MKSEKEKPVVRFYFSNSHEPDYHRAKFVRAFRKRRKMPYRGIYLDKSILRNDKRLRQVGNGRSCRCGGNMKNHIIVQRHYHFPSRGMVFNRGNYHSFRLFDEYRRISYIVICRSRQSVGKKFVDLSA